MRVGWYWRFGVVLGLCLSNIGCAQLAVPAIDPHADSDHDGLSDALEQELLTQFMPRWMIGEDDCSVRPAEFEQSSLTPKVRSDNGVIYGQAFPAKEESQVSRQYNAVDSRLVELHYYHLWRTDCGLHGHPLDTEHVAVLIEASGTPARWKALYWYAAAHEDTVCDVSQIARAQTLHAEDHGATVWVSPGKHASYLSGAMCKRGCGADRCERMTELVPAGPINLGEPGSPMNGASFIASKAWPLLSKMSNTNFPEEPIARLNQLPAADIAWFNPGRHPMQGVIAISTSTGESLAMSDDKTAAAISVARSSTSNALVGAEDSTGVALSGARGNTGNALQKSYRKTKHALGTSARGIGRALHVAPRPDASQH